MEIDPLAPLSEAKKARLEAFLETLPETVAGKLFAAIDQTDDVGLPRELIRGSLRDRLTASEYAFPTRRLDARRAFFTPFEDLFVGARSGRKRAGVIPRSSLAPIWDLIRSETTFASTAKAADRLDAAMSARKDIGEDASDALADLHHAFASEASTLCDRANSDRAFRDRVIREIGDERTFADLAELRRLAPCVDAFIEMQSLVARAAGGLGEDASYRLRSVFLKAYDVDPQIGAIFLLAVKGRLSKPWRALDLYYHFVRSGDERIDAARDAAALLAEALFDDLEKLARVLEKDGAAKTDFDPATAMMQAGHFASFADGLAGPAARIGDNVTLNRVEACRDVAVDAFMRMCELSSMALRAATPVRPMGGSTRLMAPRPDFSQALDEETRAQGLRGAEFLSGAPALGVRLGAEAAGPEVIASEAAERLEAYANDLVTEIRAAEGGARHRARALLNDVLNIGAPLLDRERAALIQDRASAASISV